ncbi:MAG: 2-C-methyl-D-erythritol 4-phosphate cytidylyltransferase [Lachnospiraceae bacterium]
MNIVVILSGGTGVRFGGKIPKQYMQLCGQDVISYPINAAGCAGSCEHVIVAAHHPYAEYVKEKYKVECCRGGNTHNETVYQALTFVKENYPNCGKILFADCVRPFLTANIIDEYFTKLEDTDAVITAQHITDSLGKKGMQFVPRDDYYLIQKPEAFRFDMLWKAFDCGSEKTAIVQQMPPEARVELYYGMQYNLKITYPEDLHLAEAILLENKRYIKPRGGLL